MLCRPSSLVVPDGYCTMMPPRHSQGDESLPMSVHAVSLLPLIVSSSLLSSDVVSHTFTSYYHHHQASPDMLFRPSSLVVPDGYCTMMPPRHSQDDESPPMSVHAVGLLFESIFHKSKSLQALG
ncbi:hypothetical protein L1887_29633 [Cichorium endivia]|nr:hypothetical protein L1887_29633 [Cichorium endivia]